VSAERNQQKIRVVIAKPGLDGHDRGVRVVAQALKDAGMEVIYLGLQQTPEMIVNAAIEEDADVVALSILSGAHMTLFPRVRKLLVEQDVGDILLTGGGIMNDAEMAELAAMGVGRLFGPGTHMDIAIDYIRNEVQTRRAARNV
jgi:methylmalonyl-CoA mutase C-terminal domain/subunit